MPLHVSRSNSVFGRAGIRNHDPLLCQNSCNRTIRWDLFRLYEAAQQFVESLTPFAFILFGHFHHLIAIILVASIAIILQ